MVKLVSSLENRWHKVSARLWQCLYWDVIFEAREWRAMFVYGKSFEPSGYATAEAAMKAIDGRKI